MDFLHLNCILHHPLSDALFLSLSSSLKRKIKATNTNAIPPQAPASPQTPPTPQKPITKYLIHLSGTGILSDYRSTDPSAPPPGTLNPRIYSDVSLADNTTIFLPPPPPPNDAGRSSSSAWIDPLHGETERIVYEAWRREEEEAKKANGGASVRVRTAIMRPPDIYGRGLGVARKTSAYVPFYVREILQGDGGGDGEGIGAAFFVGEGQNKRGWVHLEDLMGLYLKLVERAVEGGDDGAAAWGREVSFFFFFFGLWLCRLGR